MFCGECKADVRALGLSFTLSVQQLSTQDDPGMIHALVFARVGMQPLQPFYRITHLICDNSQLLLEKMDMSWTFIWYALCCQI